MIFVFFVVSFNSFSQHGLRLSYYMPIDDFAYILKPNIGFKYTYLITEKDSKLRLGVSVEFTYRNPKQDTLKYLTIRHDGFYQTALPSEWIIKKYYSFPLSAFLEYKFASDRKFSPLIGGSVFGEFSQLNYEKKIPLLSEEYVQGPSGGVGLTTYCGVIYNMNNSFEIIAKFGYRFNKEFTIGVYNQVFFSVGLTYFKE